MSIDIFTYVITALAVFRLTRLLTTDVIFEGMREKIWSKYPPSTKFGYLFTCNWCMSIWMAVLLVALTLLLPTVAYVVSLILSISALVGLVATKLDN
jgi:hypothetical protein